VHPEIRSNMLTHLLEERHHFLVFEMLMKTLIFTWIMRYFTVVEQKYEESSLLACYATSTGKQL
jgi:hypothetical protein